MFKYNKKIIIILALIAALYLPMLIRFSGLFGFEDYWIFSNVQKIDSLKKLIVFFIADQHGEFKGACEYRPVIPIFYYINYKLFGVNAYSLHLIIFIKFLAASFLLFQITTKIINPSIALLSVLIFAFFPAHSTSFIISSNSGDLIAAFFMLAVIYLKQQKYNKMITILFFVLAILTKENAYILPLILIAYDKFIDRKSLFSSIKNNILFIIITVAVFILRTLIMGGLDEDTVLGNNGFLLIYDFFNLIYVFLKIYKSIFFILLLIILFIFFMFSIDTSKKYFRVSIFLFCWFFLSILPLLGKDIGIYVHRFINPAIPFSIFTAIILFNLKNILNLKKAAYIFVIIILLISYRALYDNYQFWYSRFFEKQQCFEKLIDICALSQYENFLIIKTGNEFEKLGYAWDYFYTYGIKLELGKYQKKALTIEDIIINNIPSDNYQIYLIENNNIKLIDYNDLINYYSSTEEYMNFNNFLTAETFNYSDLKMQYYKNTGDYGLLKEMHNFKIYDDCIKFTEMKNDNIYKRIWIKYILNMRLGKFDPEFWIRSADYHSENSDIDFFLSKIIYAELINKKYISLDLSLKLKSLIKTRLLLNVYNIINNQSIDLEENSEYFIVSQQNYDFINKYFTLLIYLESNDSYFDKLLFNNMRIKNKNDLIFFLHLKYKKFIYKHFRNYFVSNEK